MADADRRRRIKVAAAAFAARRGDLGLTQEDIPRRGGPSVRTVINFESQGTLPNARSRARLERAVEWPLGEIGRIAAGPAPDFDPKLLAELRQLTPDQREWLMEWLQGHGGPADGVSAAEG